MQTTVVVAQEAFLTHFPKVVVEDYVPPLKPELGSEVAPELVPREVRVLDAGLHVAAAPPGLVVVLPLHPVAEGRLVDLWIGVVGRARAPAALLVGLVGVLVDTAFDFDLGYLI